MKIVRRSYLEGSSQISKIDVLDLLITQYIKTFRHVLIDIASQLITTLPAEMFGGTDFWL